MNIPSTDRCLNCERTEREVPLSRWRFQAREFALCSDCLPILIHKRGQLMAKWGMEESASAEESSAGQDLAF